MKLLIHSETSMVRLLKFVNGWIISYQILLCMWLLAHAEIKVDPYQLSGSLDQYHCLWTCLPLLGQQQICNWKCKISRSLSSTRKDFKYMGHLFLSWFNFNTSMDKQSHAQQNVGWNYLFTLKRSQKLNHVSKRGLLHFLGVVKGCRYISYVSCKNYSYVVKW